MRKHVKPEVERALDAAIWNLLQVKRRHPLLLAVADEFKKLGKALGSDRVRNDGAFQVLRDSFDMLVIDLHSLRQSLVKQGLFDLLKADPEQLRPSTPTEFGQITSRYVGSEPISPAEMELADNATRERRSEGINKALERLVPGADPVTAADVEALVTRFMKATKAIHEDRNRVRAHRYEKASEGARHHFIPLEDVAAHIQTLDTYLQDLYLVMSNGWHSMDMSFGWDPTGTAEDLADIVMLGSINQATMKVGMVPDGMTNGWYWKFRADFVRGEGARS